MEKFMRNLRIYLPLTRFSYTDPWKFQISPSRSTSSRKQITRLSSFWRMYFFWLTQFFLLERCCDRLEILTSEEAKRCEILFSDAEAYNEITPPKRLKPSQRNCRLGYESETLLTSSVYSFNLCRSQCRFKIALKECGCIPYFYRNIGGLNRRSCWYAVCEVIESFTDKNGKKYPICGPLGMNCLGKIKGESSENVYLTCKMLNWWISDEIVSLKSSKKKIECDCMPNCDNSNFFIQSIVSIWTAASESDLINLNFVSESWSDLAFGF